MRFRGLMLTSAAVATLVPAALSAQKQFEGIITWGSSFLPNGRGQTVVRVKGTKVRTDTGDPKSGTFTSIKDAQGRILMLIPPQKAYYVMMSNAQGLREPMKYEPTGRTETVAGYPCQYYRELDSNGRNPENRESCVTTALGFAGIGASGPLDDAAERAIRQQFPDGFLILKTMRAGKTGVEVIKVERTSLSDDLFTPPADYTEIKMTRPGS